ncbi:MAG TPA: hypothetical protein VIM89_19860 [Mucilaginibacter sp.]
MDFKQLYQQLIDRILTGTGKSTLQQRQQAFNNSGLPQPLNSLIEKVAHEAYKITDRDIAAAKEAGVTEDQLFELIICGAVGQASRQYESGLSALAEVVREGGRHAS